MQRSNISVKKIFSISILVVFIILLASCGTHSQTDYSDSDGIYNSQTPTQTEEVSEKNTPSDSYYRQYFNSKTTAYDELEDGTVFTDIDAYNSTGSIDEDGYIVEEQTQEEENSYGAWGENNGEVSVNIYNNSGRGQWNRPYWWYGSGWGYYNNWCSPFWGIGYGWGYPYYGYYGWGYPYYYGGYHNNFYNPYYGNGYNGYAYSRGRRNSDYYNGRSALAGDRYGSRDAARGRSIARENNNRRNTNNSTATRNSRNTRATTGNSRRTYDRNTSTTRARTNTNSRRNKTKQRPSTTRSNRPSVNSNNTRPNRSSTRSSTPRRSSGASRSSGSGRSRSGSRRGGGRGGRG
jgi:hypothetical protein